MENPPREWQMQVLANPAGLITSIREMHHAAQFIALTGDSLLPPAPDDSHTAMRWRDAAGGLVGCRLPLNIPVRLALVYEPFELQFLDEDYRAVAGLHLHGQNKTGILNWLRETVTDLGGRAAELRPIRHFTIPHHPVDSGAPFRKVNDVERRELARYRHNAALLLEDLTASFGGASRVRTWPHHFDTGSVIPLAAGPDGKPTQTVGIGLAIPDAAIAEPYYYVNHWSADGGLRHDDLPELPAGRWHRNGWTGAVLEASHLLAAGSAAEQQATAYHFLRAGINASLRLLGRSEQVR